MNKINFNQNVGNNDDFDWFNYLHGPFVPDYGTDIHDYYDVDKRQFESTTGKPYIFEHIWEYKRQNIIDGLEGYLTNGKFDYDDLDMINLTYDVEDLDSNTEMNMYNHLRAVGDILQKDDVWTIVDKNLSAELIIDTLYEMSLFDKDKFNKVYFT